MCVRAFLRLCVAAVVCVCLCVWVISAEFLSGCMPGHLHNLLARTNDVCVYCVEYINHGTLVEIYAVCLILLDGRAQMMKNARKTDNMYIL